MKSILDYEFYICIKKACMHTQHYITNIFNFLKIIPLSKNVQPTQYTYISVCVCIIKTCTCEACFCIYMYINRYTYLLIFIH